MTSLTHSYGPECTLQPASNPFIRRASEISNDAPTIRAHFFYSSDLPIDDPLSPIPPPSSGSAIGPPRVPPRPFSIHDNTALEEAWQALQRAQAENHGSKGAGTNDADTDQDIVRRALSSFGGPEPTSAAVEKLTNIIRGAQERRASLLEQKRPIRYGGEGEEGKTVIFTADTAPGTDTVMHQDTIATAHAAGDPHLTLCDNPEHIPFDHAMPVGTDEIGNEEFESGMSKRRHRSPFRRHDKPSRSSLHPKKQIKETILGASPSERDTTGTPFLRVSERLRRPRSRSSHRISNTDQTDGAGSLNEDNEDVSFRGGSLDQATSQEAPDDTELPGEGKRDGASTVNQKPTTVLVPVGASRLHMVEMPDLKVGRPKIM